MRDLKLHYFRAIWRLKTSRWPTRLGSSWRTMLLRLSMYRHSIAPTWMGLPCGPRISSLLARLEGMSANMEDGIENLPEVSAKLSALVEDLRAALGPEGSRLAAVLEAAEGGLGSADEALSTLAGNRGQIETAVHDLQETVSNLKSFSQQLKERPFSMVRKVHEADRHPGENVKDSKP